MVNLSTPLGVVVALAGRARLVRGPQGLVLAEHFRGAVPAPRAPAVTIGNVILLRMSARDALRRPGLIPHEGRHATQYAFWIGPLGFVPAYLAASVWSWLHCRNFALRNPFEVRAGLVDGGYLPAATLPSEDGDAPGQRE